MTIGERIDQEDPQRCLICDQIVSATFDWPICPACTFDQTSPEAYTIRRVRGLLWRSGIITDAATANSLTLSEEQQFQIERRKAT